MEQMSYRVEIINNEQAKMLVLSQFIKNISDYFMLSMQEI